MEVSEARVTEDWVKTDRKSRLGLHTAIQFQILPGQFDLLEKFLLKKL